MKRIFLVLWLALSTLAVPVLAQTGSVSVSLTAQSTDCTVAKSCAVLNIGQNVGGATLTLVGTWSGTVQFEGEGADGKTWVAISVTPSNSTTTVTSATGNGTWQVNVSGYKAVRIRCSTFTSGTISASISSSTAAARGGSGGGGGGGTPTLNQVLDPTADKTFAMGTYFLGAVSGSPASQDSGMVRLDDVGNSGAITFTAVKEDTEDQSYPLAARFTVIGQSQTGQNVGDVEGVRISAQGSTQAGSTLDNVRGLIITNQASGAVAPTNSTALQIDDVTGATNNWAIKTGAGRVEFDDTGIFTGAAQHESATSSIGGACPYHTIIGGAYTTDALSGCAVTPSSGVTNGFTVGVGGYVQVNDPNEGGQFTKVEGVGGYFAVNCTASHTQCEGGASQVVVNSSLTGVTALGHEVSVIPGNVGDSGYGVLADMVGATTQVSGDNMPAFAVQTPSSTGTFTSGFKCEDAATSTFHCSEVGKILAAGKSGSQELFFTGNDGSADFTAFFNLTGNGFFQFYGAPMIDGAFGGYLTSTLALAYNELVKIDTSNADSVVVCTTADTTACMGFVADKLGSGVGGNCGASSMFCAVITMPGSLVKGILGTGTCSIGDYVIVDSTTNGDIKCTGSAPALHAEIGVALSAQTMVGSLVDILTKFE